MPILVTTDFPPAHGGVQRLMVRLAEGIAAHQREVIVVAPNAKGCESMDALSPYRVMRYPARGGKLLASFGMSLSYLKALFIARDRVTIAAIWYAGVAVVLVPRFFRGKFIVLAHGSEIAPSRWGIRRLLMRFVYARADAVIANSRFTAGLLASAGVRRNVKHFTLGVDPAAIASDRASVPTILSVGRLVARKGFDRILDALALLRTEFPEVRYEIVGNGPELASLQERARRLGVCKHVRFIVSAADDELWRAYSHAWCFALPARRVEDDVEGFGIVYLEAAMAGLPSIGGIDSGATDAILDGVTGLLVDGTSVPAVAAALRTLLSDPDFAANMGRQARERALAHFTWQQTTQQILSYLP